jgi:hypothetical protein
MKRPDFISLISVRLDQVLAGGKPISKTPNSFVNSRELIYGGIQIGISQEITRIANHDYRQACKGCVRVKIPKWHYEELDDQPKSEDMY